MRQNMASGYLRALNNGTFCRCHMRLSESNNPPPLPYRNRLISTVYILVVQGSNLREIFQNYHPLPNIKCIFAEFIFLVITIIAIGNLLGETNT